MKASQLRWPGGEIVVGVKMADWDELDQDACWDWIGVGLRKRRAMWISVHYKIA